MRADSDKRAATASRLAIKTSTAPRLINEALGARTMGGRPDLLEATRAA
jgi:hypothetical protein